MPRGLMVWSLAFATLACAGGGDGRDAGGSAPGGTSTDTPVAGSGAGASASGDAVEEFVGGLGSPCRVHDHCGDPSLICRVGAVPGVLLGQCSLPCGTDADCTGARADGRCLDAFCMVGCVGTRTCPLGTLCWDGACRLDSGNMPTDPVSEPPQSDPPEGAEPPTCLECLQRVSQLDCTMAGCFWQPSCGGFATACRDMRGSRECGAQRGCTWSFENNFCNGNATGCSVLSEFQCSGQAGCSANLACLSGPGCGL